VSIRVAVMLGFAALTACSPGASDGSAQAACEQQAERDPAVMEIYSRTNGDYTYAGYQANYDLREAKRLAVLRCMRAKGLAPPGGVQAVKLRVQ
jgi:hypothetical protein